MFNLVQHHKYSLTELEDMIPFELEIYCMMLMEHLRAEEERMKAAKGKRGIPS